MTPRMAQSLSFFPSLRFPAALALTVVVASPVFAAENGTWSKYAVTGPPVRTEACAAYDVSHARMIMFGGGGPAGETWSLDLVGGTGWKNFAPTASPSPRRAGTLVYDPVRNRMILFGGDDGSYRNDVWALNLDGVPTWTLLTTAGTSPAGRMWAVGAYDPVRDRILYFGGYNSGAMYGDVWELRLSASGGPAWGQISTNPGPSPRWAAVGCYDADNDRLIITTGLDAGGYRNDVWALSFAGTPTWTALTPAGTPPNPTFLATGVYEAARHRLLVHGGFPDLNNKVWQLTLDGVPGWTLLTPDGLTPPLRRAHVSVFDPAFHRMITFGGFDVSNETWALTFPAVAPAPPNVLGLSPTGGPEGTNVTVLGSNLDGTTRVTFNGLDAPVFGSTYSSVSTQVPVGATTGKVSVTTAYGSGSSTADFVVDQSPEIVSASPLSGKEHASITIRGHHFTSVNRVTFGGTGSATFSVKSESVLVAVVDHLARSGRITLYSPVGFGVSGFDFTVLPLSPNPQIVRIRDVPRDQGGHVVVQWAASDYDLAANRSITGYRVWRRAPSVPLASPSRLVRARDVPGGLLPNALEDEFWEPIAEMPAAFLTGYSYTADTPFDSTAEANEYTAFFVQALTPDAFTFYSSAVDSGYSVDDLAPAQPASFVAEYTAERVSMHWHPSGAADFRQFRLYRGTSPTFSLTPASLVTATRDTAYVDATPGAPGHYYKLVAVDLHGNESRVALVSPAVPVATLASFVGSEPSERSILLTWYAGGNPGMRVEVERRDERSDWIALGEVIVDGSGFLRFEDDDVTAGTRYAYRLGIEDGESMVFTPEVWVTASTPAFAMVGPWPNPSSHGRFSVAFSLPTAEPGTLELWDVAGRRVDRREIAGTSRQVVSFGDRARLAPGLYLLRMTQGERRVLRHVVVLD